MTDTEIIHTGGCLCGAVRYETRGALRDVIACHCSQCRRTSGHYFAATAVVNENLTLTEDRGLKWFQSSDNARRGFCSECGSSGFWEVQGKGRTSICAGTLDNANDIKLAGHIFIEDKGAYYEIDDGLPRKEGGDSSTLLDTA